MDLLFSTAFTLWGTHSSWAEVLAFGLALAMVGCNMREIHWGWPLAIASSLLYLGVFWRSRLYGDAVLQIFFAVVAFWGWLAWLRRSPHSGKPLKISVLSPTCRWYLAVAALTVWPALGLFLKNFTDSDVPWWDAFPTALSLLGQFLLGRKVLENWLVWLAVNIVATALFAYKGLWLTAVLYALFAALSVWGWRAWQLRMRAV